MGPMGAKLHCGLKFHFFRSLLEKKWGVENCIMHITMGRLEDLGELELQTLRNAPKDCPGGPVEGTEVQSLLQEDSTIGRATKPANHINRSHCREKTRHFSLRLAPARQNKKAHLGRQRPSAAN